MTQDELNFSRLATADDIADFFCANANADYISHSELQGGRALAPGVWNPDLRQLIFDQANAILKAQGDASCTAKIYCVYLQHRLLGVAFLSLSGDTNGVFNTKRFAVLEDIIISPDARGMRVGKRFLDFIIENLKVNDVHRLFLESGITNHKAHDFFEREGFQQTSVVMMRELVN
ncbi:GNAT family N-acetyltransferase [Undibacterium sp. SXout11W]|uniref:GNAT family N-acetyltransferase n=1 Tax=Undibacterium sp. SXout11W TaxID=3413050 RepID=UPI003BF0F984